MELQVYPHSAAMSALPDAVWNDTEHTLTYPFAGLEAPTLVCFTPIVIASWKRIRNLLNTGRTYGMSYLVISGKTTDKRSESQFKLKPFLKSDAYSTTWQEFPRAYEYGVKNTQPCNIAVPSPYLSNLAALTLASLNDDTLSSKLGISHLTNKPETDPLQDYLNFGVGKAPMVLTTEAHYIASSIEEHPDEPTLIHLDPSPLVQHTLTPYSPAGKKLVTFLSSNNTILKRLRHHGYRLPKTGSSTFGLCTLHNIADTPSASEIVRLNALLGTPAALPESASCAPTELDTSKCTEYLQAISLTSVSASEQDASTPTESLEATVPPLEQLTVALSSTVFPNNTATRT